MATYGDPGTRPQDNAAAEEPASRIRRRDALVLAFGFVEFDRLLGAAVRLGRSDLSVAPHPPFGPPSWAVALDVTGALIAAVSFAFVHAHFRGLRRARALGTVVLTAAGLHTSIMLTALGLRWPEDVDPVIALAYAATSVPILVLAALHLGEALSPTEIPPEGS